MAKKIAIGVLAFNEENFIEEVILKLDKLNQPIFVINDASTDNTKSILDKLSKNLNFRTINNVKNFGAGYSTLKLIETVKSEGFEFILKVDGDDQFKLDDVLKIIDIINSENYDFVKSNRFWENGIEGKIPFKRYLGNLIATVILQFISGTNKIYDPLNGLFAVNVKILDQINFKKYPMRYGYPFYLTILSIISFFNTYQINNTISYKGQKSNLNSLKMLYVITKLSFHFFILKIKKKIKYGKYHRSAFLDLAFIFFTFIDILLIIRISLIFTSIQFFQTSNFVSWLIILMLFLIFTVFLFVEAFIEEKNIRNLFVKNDEMYQ